MIATETATETDVITVPETTTALVRTMTGNIIVTVTATVITVDIVDHHQMTGTDLEATTVIDTRSIPKYVEMTTATEIKTDTDVITVHETMTILVRTTTDNVTGTAIV